MNIVEDLPIVGRRLFVHMRMMRIVLGVSRLS